MTDPKQILAQARTFLLVDWPSPAVPRALLTSGFTVFGYSPHRYSKAEIVPALPQDTNSHSVFPPRDPSESGYLIFRQLPGRPTGVDVVAIYRPEKELPLILTEHLLPLGAKVLWFLRPVTSDHERLLAQQHDLICVEDCDLIAMAQTIRKSG